MQPAVILSTAFLAATALAQSAPLNTSQEYALWTHLKPGQSGKDAYEGLQLSTYHFAAGESDIVFSESNDNSRVVKGWLSPATNTSNSTNNYQELDLGTPTYSWTMVIAISANFYAAWEPVRVVVGAGGDRSSYGIEAGFFINQTGLQWSSEPDGVSKAYDSFGGWIVCDWWHGVPQLFVRNKYYNTTAPSSCADVDLVPYYY